MRQLSRARSWMACLGTALAVASVAGCDGRPKGEGATVPEPKSGPAVAVIDVGGGVPEQESGGLFGVGGRKRTFDELLRVLDGLSSDDDKDHVAVLVKFGSASIGAARSQEIGEHLEALNKKKKVVCHGDAFTNATYMTAARGCSQIWLSPAGEVASVGLAAQVVYMRKLLADELHLSIDFLQIGKYKGAEEPITRDGPSPEARASLTGVLADMRKTWLDTVGQARKKPGIVEAMEDGPYGPVRAKTVGVVDEVGYVDEATDAAKKAGNAVREDIVFGPGAESSAGGFDDLVRALAGEEGESGPVALLRASGSIAMTSGGNGLLGGRAGIIEKDFDRTVRQLEKDDDVKVVVLRIDSPGGSALASDLMWHQLMKLRRKKPLVVSVGEMAASGGMYLASAGDFIFAEPMSIVGSIGVVGGKVGVGDALEKIGVHAETFAANTERPGAGTRAAYESPLVKWDDPTRERVRESMTSVYDLFLSRVSEGRSTRGRSISREKVAESAEGRIFSGREGKERGLVDELGGLTAALAKARELAGLPADAHVSLVGSKSTIFDTLGAGDSASERAEQAAKAAMPTPMSLLERAAPSLVPFVQGIAPLSEGEHAVVAMPFALTVR